MYFYKQIKQSQHNTRLIWKTINDKISLKKIKTQSDITNNDHCNFWQKKIKKKKNPAATYYAFDARDKRKKHFKHKYLITPIQANATAEILQYFQLASILEQLFYGNAQSRSYIHSRTSPKNFGGAMKFCPNFVTFAQIMILEYISDMTKKFSEFLRQKPILS